ncbi:MAG: DNA-binding protein [Anaerolineales bacterium]|jgi:predicted DNA-binding protein with PD1-like motif
MKTYALRLHPGQDLIWELERFCEQRQLRAGLVLTCVGSLRRAALRLANQPTTEIYERKFEIVSLVGTLSPDGPHLHISLSDAQGKTIGGHLQEGCLVNTTAEIVIAELEGKVFLREMDPQTGYEELVISEEEEAI